MNRGDYFSKTMTHISTVTSVCVVNPTDDLFATEHPQTRQAHIRNEHMSLRKTKSVPIICNTKYADSSDSDPEEPISFSSYLNVPKQKKKKKLQASKSAACSPASSILNLFEYKDVLKKLTQSNASFSKQKSSSQRTTPLGSPNGTPETSRRSSPSPKTSPRATPKTNLSDHNNNIPFDNNLNFNKVKNEIVFSKDGVIDPKERTRNFVVTQCIGWEV